MIRRVAVITDFLNNFGGTEYYTVQLCLGLKRQGVDVRLFCSQRPTLRVWENILRQESIPIHYAPLNIGRAHRLPERLLCSLMGRYFRFWRPDIIHANPVAALALTWVQSSFHGEIPIVGTEYSEASQRCGFWYEPDLFDHINSFSAVIATCEHVRTGVQTYLGFSGPVFFIPHFILAPQDSTNDASVPPHHLGCIARLSVEKGLDYLIAAMRQIIVSFPESTLSIYGDGDERSHLTELIKCLNLDHCIKLKGTFTPMLDTDRVIGAHVIFIQPSLFESIPTSLLEIIARRRVIVASAVGGIPELLGDGSGSLLVPPADSRAIADAVIMLLERPGELAERGDAGRRLYFSQYDREAALNQLLDAFEAVIAHKKSAVGG